MHSVRLDLMSSPPGLRDAFSEAGWTVLTRKSRNRQQCSRRRGCSDKRGTLVDESNHTVDDIFIRRRTFETEKS